ncbi:MAG TPA: aspartate/glutamate racemase family protein [Longimicrobium sp.]|nr:aspartate/glutamate racemase family protein [Longimicrobium sp.]
MRAIPPLPAAAAPQPVLGILGGMGPVASAAFVRSLYREAAFRREQAAPACILLSDPLIPDRTQALLEGRGDEVLCRLIAGLERLEAAGATRTLAACVTIHHWVPQLPPALRRRLISLVDVILDEVAATPGRALLLCTSGARHVRIFESHPGWAAASGSIVLPGEGDQARVHRWVFALKAQRRPRAVLDGIGEMTARYGADRWISGCTEFHLAGNALRARGGDPAAIIDPLHVVARRLACFMAPAVRRQ